MVVGAFHGSAQAIFVLMREGGADEGAARAFQFLEGLVHGDAAEQHEEHGAAGLEVAAQALHELVVDAHIGQCAGNGARARAHGRAEQGIHEEQPDEQAPETAGNGARTGEIIKLKQLDLAVFLADGDDGVFQIDKIFLLHFKKAQTHFFCLELIRVGNNNKSTHGTSFFFLYSRADGKNP